MENMQHLYPIIQFSPAHSDSIVFTLESIDAYERGIGMNRLNLRPKYQRGEAWKPEYKEKLIYSLITNYPIGNFIVRKLDNMNEATAEVVDGQQRLLTIRAFVDKGMELSSELSKQIIKEKEDFFKYDMEHSLNLEAVKIYKKYLNNPKQSIKLTFKTLPSLLQTQIKNYNLSIIDILRSSDEAVAQYFRFIQNQERLRAGEIINAIPHSAVSAYLDKITDRDKFLRVIGWKEERKEFEKIFYSMIGIFDQKLLLGTTDKNIIDYISEYKDISSTSEEMVNNMVDAINYVSNVDFTNLHFNKRLLKFFLLLAGYKKIDFTIDTKRKFSTLCDINAKIALFNSGDTQKIAKLFADYPESIQEKYRNVFLLGRGSHSNAVTKEKITYLAEIINYELNQNSEITE
ncbi:MAG: DUF262 domain-containing protein [Clostridiales bacterium]|nr:DUF262 domain-containing protein [Clostridiales bacterium]